MILELKRLHSMLLTAKIFPHRPALAVKP